MSLSPPKKVKYVPKKGNPNLMVLEEEEVEEEEEEPIQSVEPEKSTSPPIERDKRVIEFENRLYPLLFQALAPLYKFVGYIEAESGKRIYYRYDSALSVEQKMNPLVKGAVTVDEFKIKNTHLGPAILNLIHEEPLIAVRKKEKIERHIGLIGINAMQFRTLYRQLIDPNATDLHFQIFPVALWDILPTSTFQFILGTNTFGAIEMSAKELQKDLKLLIISDAVNHKFAQFVAKKFVSPKQNAFVSGIQGGNLQYRIASGFNTSVASNTKSLLGARHWFKDVIVVDNPALREIEPLRELRYNQLQEIYRDQLAFDAQLNRRNLDDFPPVFTDLSTEQMERFEQFMVFRQMVAVKNEFVRLRYEYENLQMTAYPKVYWK